MSRGPTRMRGLAALSFVMSQGRRQFTERPLLCVGPIAVVSDVFDFRGTEMIRVGIVGASGYGGGELMRILSSHPHVRMQAIVSETNAAKPPSAAFPGLR